MKSLKKADPPPMTVDLKGQSDEDLAERSRKHDEVAYEELVRRYMKPIFNFARQYSKTSEDAEDITQDTFLKVWKYIGRYGKGRAFKPWLYTIARNTALDLIKKKKAIVFTELDDDLSEMRFADTIEDTAPLQYEIFENALLAGRLAETMAVLHPEHRAILVMHYREKMTFDEIALVVGKPMNTVKSWHRRALLKLREHLTHHAAS